MKNNLNQFDLNLLVAFDALMTERGVTRAGRAMGITQAAMSNTLRRLREIFDDPLFVKSGQHMEPTALALELAEPVQESLRHVRRVLEQEGFDPIRSQYVFRIGMVDYAAALILPQLQELLREKAPGITLEVLDIGGGDDELQYLQSGAADVVLSRFQWVPPKVLLHRLYQMEYVAIFREGHPLVGETLTMEAFLKARHVHYYPRGMESTVVDEGLAQMGKSRQIVVRLPTLAMVPFMLADSDLMAIVPSGTARCIAPALGLRIEPIPLKSPPLRMAVAWHPRTDKSPPNIWLREQMKSLLTEHP